MGEENAREQKSIDTSNNVLKNKVVQEESSKKLEKPKGEKLTKNVAEPISSDDDKTKKLNVVRISQPEKLSIPKNEKEVDATIEESKSKDSATKIMEVSDEIDKQVMKDNSESLQTLKTVKTEEEKGKMEQTAGTSGSKTAETEAEEAKMKRQEDFLVKMREEEQNKKKLIKEKIGKQLRQIQEDKKNDYKNLEMKKAAQVEKKPIPASPQVRKVSRVETQKYQKSTKEKEIKSI